jgi:hypothetical protein
MISSTSQVFAALVVARIENPKGDPVSLDRAIREAESSTPGTKDS